MGGDIDLTQLNELNKKDRTVHWLNTHQAVNLSCIHCQEGLNSENSLVCVNGHRFDMAKQGYFSWLRSIEYKIRLICLTQGARLF